MIEQNNKINNSKGASIIERRLRSLIQKLAEDFISKFYYSISR